MVEKARKDRLGFTLAEITLVITIFVIMAGCLVPFIAMVRARSCRARCEENLRQISLALHTYAADHNERFPSRISDLYPAYLGDEKIFACPAVKGGGTKEGPAYSYVAGFSEKSPATAVIVADREGNHGQSGRNVLRISGLIQWVRAEKNAKTAR